MSEGADALGTLVEQAEPVVETTEVPEAGAGIPETDLTPETPAEPQAEEPKPEPTKAETSAREISKALRELREAHPDKAPLIRQMQDAFFRAQTYQQHYASPEEAQRAKVTFEALGGEEGVATLQQAAEQIRTIDEQSKTGSPELVDRWAKDFPDGFKKAVPVALENLEKLDARAYNEAMRPHLTRSVLSSGLPDAIERIAHYASNPSQLNAELLKRELTSVQQWIGGLNQAEQDRLRTVNDPRVKEFQDKEQSFAQRESEMRQKQIGGEIQPYLKSSIEAGLTERSKTLKPEMKAALFNDVTQEINTILAGDKAYQANMKSLLAKGDVAAVVKYIKANVDVVRSRAIREVWAKKVAPFETAKPGPKPGTPKPAANGKAPVNNLVLQLPAKPPVTDLDLDRDPGRMLFMTGKGYLKTGPNAGRLVSWKRTSA